MDIVTTDSLDLYVTNNGDIQLDVDVGDVKRIGQRIKTRLLWIAGEWRLGPDIGFPWFEQVLVKKPDFDMVTELLRREIAAVDGVQSVSVQLLSFNQATRRVKFEFRATTDDGNSIVEEVEFDG